MRTGFKKYIWELLTYGQFKITIELAEITQGGSRGRKEEGPQDTALGPTSMFKVR